EDDLICALQAVLDHHDALRLRLEVAGASGELKLEVGEAGAVPAADCLRRVEVFGLDAGERGAGICEHARAAAGRLSAGAGGPAAGVLVQAVWFDAGGSDAGRLLVMVHHLAVDGVSWRILVPELAAAWSAIAGGGVAEFAPRGTSFRRWAQRLAWQAQEARFIGELSFWTEMLSAP